MSDRKINKIVLRIEEELATVCVAKEQAAEDDYECECPALEDMAYIVRRTLELYDAED